MINMSCNGWYSKQDVIKDLVEVTGKYNDFGEHYVVGENPPPAQRTDEDDEDLLRFYGGQKPMQSDYMEKPDLVGITQMLRMVDNYEAPNDFSTSNGDHMNTKTTKTKLANMIVSISKLNPSVDEFVPQKSVSDSIDVVGKVSKKELKLAKDVSLCNVVDAKETANNDGCDIVKTNISDNRIDISQLLSSELKEMREQLKTKICDNSKVKSVKLRRERNLAIATLLKLSCQKPAADENKPNLISPDYFKNNPANRNDVTEQFFVKSVSKNNADDNFTEDNLNTSSEAEIIKKEIAASVEKVTEWLLNSKREKISEENNNDIKKPIPNIPEIKIPIKETIKRPLLHLGPVTFKRKTNNKHPMSPVSLQSDNSRTKSESFVPSVYASELTKKYIQQNKQKQKTQTDIWKSLETRLKEKDEATIKQLQTMS